MPKKAAKQLFKIAKGLECKGATNWYNTHILTGNDSQRAILKIASNKPLMAFIDKVKQDRQKEGVYLDHAFVTRKKEGVWHVGIRFKHLS